MLKNCRRRVNELKEKSEARAEAKLWAKVARARYGAKQGIEAEPKMETAALATESGKPYWLSDILDDLDSTLEREQNSSNSIAAKTDEVLESIKESYDADGANELSEDELRTAILNRTVPTAIADA